jgi:hypothetical protein
MREPREIYEITQIIPAAPGTFALYYDDEAVPVEGAPRQVFRVPVPAWGIYITHLLNDEGESRYQSPYELAIRRGVTPLVPRDGELVPASESLNYAGVRIDNYVGRLDFRGFDPPEDGVDFSCSWTPPEDTTE